MRKDRSWWQADPAAAALAVFLIALVPVLLIVGLFGAWGFWLVVLAAAVFPIWWYVRSRAG